MRVLSGSESEDIALPAWLLGQLLRVVEPWAWRPAKALLAALRSPPQRGEPSAAGPLRRRAGGGCGGGGVGCVPSRAAFASRRLEEDSSGLYAMLSGGGGAAEAAAAREGRPSGRERKGEGLRGAASHPPVAERHRSLSAAPEWTATRRRSGGGGAGGLRACGLTCASALRCLRCAVCMPPEGAPAGVAGAAREQVGLSTRRVAV